MILPVFIFDSSKLNNIIHLMFYFNKLFYLFLHYQVYFDYLQHLFQMLQRLPEASRSLKNTTEDEWQFTKQICPHTKGLEAQASTKFWCVYRRCPQN